MLLAVDIGNTQTHIGTFRDEKLVEHWRFATVRESTADELGAALRNLLALRGLGFDDLDASVASSTVPELGPEWVTTAARYLGHEMLLVGPGVKTGMPIRMENPRELGPDRLVNAVAAYERVQGACIVVDFGTANTFDVVSASGALEQRLEGDLDAQRDDPAQVLAGRGDDVEGVGGAEVHDDAGALHAVVGRDSIYEAVGAQLARVLHADRHPRLDPGADEQHLVV